MRILIDTHVLLWWQARHKKLSRLALREIARARSVLVSAVTCWEVATLLAQRRIALDRPLSSWLTAMESDDKIEILPLSARAAVLAFDLDAAGFHADPADRLIYASAATEMISLVTADERMQTFAKEAHPSVQVIWD